MLIILGSRLGHVNLFQSLLESLDVEFVLGELLLWARLEHPLLHCKVLLQPLGSLSLEPVNVLPVELLCKDVTHISLGCLYFTKDLFKVFNMLIHKVLRLIIYLLVSLAPQPRHLFRV